MMNAYPSELSRTWRLEDGTNVTIRPIRPEDAAIERAFVHRLSQKSKYYRFLSGLQDLSTEMVRRFTRIDYDRDMALIATVELGSAEVEIAVGRFVSYQDGESCEFAIVVDDPWQHRGIGYQILSDLIRIARSRGLKTMKGLILAVNREMIELARCLDFEIRRVPGDATVVEAVKDLRSAESTLRPPNVPGGK
jgi:acetyltransferase